ncbi:hypothetical protein HNP65_001080 [Thermosipho japonicus]|uniref:Outer membrane protein beta-barrel domain-containing protein n=1 Tax=Thermosipho japonicus TaxID=90323 RepID=A0A841GGD3_9BACT|nr:hypothetical protein [Thermosipho japonicus]MBB6062642.1 hypothetical protein [Thermosipho japonicus]
MKKLLIIILITISIFSFSMKFGFSTDQGLWFSEKIENFRIRIGYPYSQFGLIIPSEFLSYGVNIGYLLNNSNSLLEVFFDTSINNFYFKSFVKTSFHAPENYDETTETGRIYVGMTPAYYFTKNIRLDFNFEYSAIYLYYDPGSETGFPSIFNTEDIFRYNIGLLVSYFMEDIRIFLGMSFKYRWIDYLFLPLFNDQIISFGIEVEANGY